MKESPGKGPAAATGLLTGPEAAMVRATRL